MTPIHLISHTIFDNKARLCVCLCLKEIVGADTCRSPTASVHTLFSALGTRGFYSRAASLQASSPFGGYGEKQKREKRPRGDEKARRRGFRRSLARFRADRFARPNIACVAGAWKLWAQERTNKRAPVLSCTYYTG